MEGNFDENGCLIDFCVLGSFLKNYLESNRNVMYVFINE